MRENDILAVNRRELLEVRFQLHSADPRHQLDEAYPLASGRLPRITQVLALAIRFDEMIGKGEAKDYADVARLTALCRERISQIMRLNNLAPDIQVEVLYLPPTPTGKYPISETALRRVASPLVWSDQRREWARIKEDLVGA